MQPRSRDMHSSAGPDMARLQRWHTTPRTCDLSWQWSMRSLPNASKELPQDWQLGTAKKAEISCSSVLYLAALYLLGFARLYSDWRRDSHSRHAPESPYAPVVFGLKSPNGKVSPHRTHRFVAMTIIRDHRSTPPGSAASVRLYPTSVQTSPFF